MRHHLPDVATATHPLPFNTDIYYNIYYHTDYIMYIYS